MKVITPTPSQAAVILKKFLQQNGMEIPLSLAQEASARMRGYVDLQALVSDVEPRTGEFRQGRPHATQVAPTGEPQADNQSQRLCILALFGDIVFDDMETGHLVLRNHDVLVPWAMSDGQDHGGIPLEHVALGYLREDGEHRKISMEELVRKTRYLGDDKWQLPDSTIFRITQASVEMGTNPQGVYLAPVTVGFSSGRQYSGYAEYTPSTGEVCLAEDVEWELDRDINEVVMSIIVEIAGQGRMTYARSNGKLELEGLDELSFGTRMGQVNVAKPAFVSYGSEPKTPVLSWNEVLHQGVSKKAHRSDVRTNASFGGNQCMYLGRGEWRYDAEESFRLYDETGNLWIPSSNDLR
jgi:hypothetical protein